MLPANHDWKCANCRILNSSRRLKCSKCGCRDEITQRCKSCAKETFNGNYCAKCEKRLLKEYSESDSDTFSDSSTTSYSSEESDERHKKDRKFDSKATPKLDLGPDGIFTDKNFPPGSESLNNMKHPPLLFIDPARVKWKRVTEIELPSGVERKLICSILKQSDVQQGKLGDCWLLSIISALTFRGRILKKIFQAKEINQEGHYTLRIFVGGSWNYITIDDYLPCDLQGELIFAKAVRGQFWVPLLEKALAKIKGGYNGLEGGKKEDISQIFTMFTGYGCETLILSNTPNLRAIYTKLVKGVEKEYLMVANCYQNKLITPDEYKQAGLLSDHAYSISTINEVDGSKYGIVMLRNPLNSVGKNEFVELSFEDEFMKFFHEVAICKA